MDLVNKEYFDVFMIQSLCINLFNIQTEMTGVEFKNSTPVISVSESKPGRIPKGCRNSAQGCEHELPWENAEKESQP